MSEQEPYQNYLSLLRQQNKIMNRANFIIDSDSSDSEYFGTGRQEENNTQTTSGVRPNPSTSGTRNSASEEEVQPSTSGVRPSTSGNRSSDGEEEISDSEISNLSSFGTDEPAIQHFKDVTREVNQEFLPVTSLTMPTKKKRANTSPPRNSYEPAKKKKKTMHSQVMGIGVDVIRAHHRQEKKIGFLVSC